MTGACDPAAMSSTAPSERGQPQNDGAEPRYKPGAEQDQRQASSGRHAAVPMRYRLNFTGTAATHPPAGSAANMPPLANSQAREVGR